MFCAKCGSSINDDAVFCPSCGKPAKPEVSGIPQAVNEQRPNQVTVLASNLFSGNANYGSVRPYLLTTLTGRLFSLFFEIFLWLALVTGAITGGVIGAALNYSSPVIGAIFGVIIGTGIALVLDVISGGLTSIFMRMNHNLEELKRQK
jgi:hypothetical protein